MSSMLQLVERFRRERGDRDRHVLQGFLALASGDGDRVERGGLGASRAPAWRGILRLRAGASRLDATARLKVLYASSDSPLLGVGRASLRPTTAVRGKARDALHGPALVPSDNGLGRAHADTAAVHGLVARAAMAAIERRGGESRQWPLQGNPGVPTASETDEWRFLIVLAALCS